MQEHSTKDIARFHIAGINYKKSDAAVRGHFAISSQQYLDLLSLAPSYGISEVFVLSTCNRTEIFGVTDDPSQLIRLLCSQTAGNQDLFLKLCYVKKGMDAITHLFEVAAGIDSQILGDYEIVGQIKQAVQFSRSKNSLGCYLDRLVSAVLQSSKVIKNQTVLSGGTVSVSFAAVQCIKKFCPKAAGKKILLIGTGKIGRNTCKNLIDYIGTRNITLINRTEEKAALLASDLGLKYAPFERIHEEIGLADIIVVATNAENYTITPGDLVGDAHKLVIDLSIPNNVDPSCKLLTNVQLLNVDELSKMKDETVKRRELEVPKAKDIISVHIREFIKWNEMRRHVPILKAVKSKLQQITIAKSPVENLLALSTREEHDEKIQQVINVMAMKMRMKNQQGCHYIEAINDFIAAGRN
ncbi:MAG: glutamyl-tRNA reductase [Chitinophagaceae bacterium]